MKRLLSVFLLTTSFMISHTGLASNLSVGGRCTGSASCRACTNCKYCKHCNAGGSCGVCSSGGTNRSYSNSSSNTFRSNTRSYTPNSITSSTTSIQQKIGIMLRNTNVRNIPSTNGDRLFMLETGEAIEILSFHGEWIKIRVNKYDTVGYVIARNVM